MYGRRYRGSVKRYADQDIGVLVKLCVFSDSSVLQASSTLSSLKTEIATYIFVLIYCRFKFLWIKPRKKCVNVLAGFYIFYISFIIFYHDTLIGFYPQIFCIDLIHRAFPWQTFHGKYEMSPGEITRQQGTYLRSQAF